MVAISPDGRLIAGAGNGLIALWDRESGEIISGINSAGGYNFSQVLFSPDGASLVSVDSQNFVIIYKVNAGQLYIHRLLPGSTYVSAAFHPAGDRLVTGELDGGIRIWNPETGEELLALNGHNKAVNSEAYSRDGAKLASASADGTTVVWDAESGERLLTLDMSPIGVGQVAFSHDGRYLITANWDNTIRLHILDLDELISLAGQRLRRGFTDKECQQFLHMETCPD